MKPALLIKALVALAALSGGLVLTLVLFATWNEQYIPPASRMFYYQLYLDAFKAIVIGFGVATFGILIPAVASETRHRFERLREARHEYSEIKTGVDYLALRLCTMSLEAAVAHVQSIHVHKHKAELYDELDTWLLRRFKELAPDYSGPHAWLDAMYGQLEASRKTLESHVATWDAWPPETRLQHLLEGQVRKERLLAPDEVVE